MGIHDPVSEVDGDIALPDGCGTCVLDVHLQGYGRAPQALDCDGRLRLRE